MSKEIPKNLCVAPWVSIMAYPDGVIKPCCISEYPSQRDNLKNYSKISDAANSPVLKDLRKSFLNGEKPDMCKHCWMLEENSIAKGSGSYRSFLNGEFLHTSLDVIEQTHEDGSIDNFKMKYYDLRWSNICNFACVSCGTLSSSRWAIELEMPERVYHIDNNNALMEDIISNHLDSLKRLYLVGGEPFLMSEHWALLDALCQSGRAKNVGITINTNLSLLQWEKKNILNYLSQFKYVEIVTSLDHIGGKAELIRYGTVWQDILDNLKYIRDLKLTNTLVVTNTVISTLNILDLPYILRTFWQLYQEGLMIPYLLSQALQPTWLHCRNLPREELQRISKELIDFKNEITEENEHNENIKQKLKTFIHFSIPKIAEFIVGPGNPDAEELNNKFVKEMAILDKRRNTDWRQTLPELAEVIGRR